MATLSYDVTATSTTTYPVTIDANAKLVNELITDVQDVAMIDDLEGKVTGFSAVTLEIPIHPRFINGQQFTVIAYPTGTGIDPTEKIVSYNYTYTISLGMTLNTDRSYT